MPAPLIIGGVAVVGGAATAPIDSGSSDDIANSVGFNHEQKYSQIHGGPGNPAIEKAITAWRNSLVEDLEEVATLLDEANRKAGVMWQGRAAEQHGDSLRPMTQFIRDAQDVSRSVGDAATEQGDAFGKVKGMPEPVKVDATDSMLEKGGAFLFGTETDLQKQEQQATEKAQEAKRIYDDYDQAVQTSSSRMPSFPTPPEMAYEQNAGPRGGTGVATSTGAPSTTGTAQPVGGGMTTVNATGEGSQLPSTPGTSGTGGTTGTPAGTGSSWATPPGTAPGGAPPGAPGAPGTPGTAPGAPGVGGGIAAPGALPGGPRGGAATPGGRTGAPGARTGTGTPGSRGGAGNGLGPGGRSGVGTPGANGTAGTAASGSATSGRGGLAGAPTRGQPGEDEENERPTWLEENDDVWFNDMPRTAPAVLGEWDAEDR